MSISATVASHVGRASLERAVRCQSRNGRAIDGIGSSDFSHRLAGVQTLQRFLALMRRHLARPTETNAARLGALAALTGASADQFTFELGKSAEDSEHQPAVRGRGVGPAVLQRLEAG